MAGLNIDSSQFRENIVAGINQAMLKAAEPLIQQTLKDIETRMRGTLAQYLISLIEQNMVMQYYGSELRITLNQAKPTKEGGAL